MSRNSRLDFIRERVVCRSGPRAADPRNAGPSCAPPSSTTTKGYGAVTRRMASAGGALLRRVRGMIARQYGSDVFDKPIPRT